MLAAAILGVATLRYRTVWRAKLPKGDPFWSGESPHVVDGRALCALCGPGPTCGVEALDARTGRPLWRFVEFVHEFPQLASGGGHLMVRIGGTVWQVDPRNGRRVASWPSPLAGLGPVVDGDRMVLETARGRLEAFDLRTRLPLWRAERAVDPAARYWNAATCVAGGALWDWTLDGRLRGFDLANGRVRFDRARKADLGCHLTAMGDAALVGGEDAPECWCASDGATRWSGDRRRLARVAYVPGPDELWSVSQADGLLHRFRASDGVAVGAPERVATGGSLPIRLMRSGDGYAISSSGGTVLFDRRGRRVAEARGATVSLWVSADRDGFVGRLMDEVWCVRPVPFVGPFAPLPRFWRNPFERSEAVQRGDSAP